MRKSDALLRGGLSENEAMRIVVLLASMGIEPLVEHDSYGRLDLYVAETDLDRATGLLAEETGAGALGDSARRRDVTDTRARFGPTYTAGERDGLGGPHSAADVAAPHSGDEIAAPEAWFGRGAAAVIALMALCVAVFVVAQTGADPGSRSRMLELGAIGYAQIHAGEYWRFVSAIFLHFDLMHLLSNMSVMLILAPPLAHQVGAARFTALFIASGVGGNVASHLLVPTAGLKAGASGAIAGVLGGLGGLALRPERQTRYRSWQRLGAMAAIYGLLIGFGPGRDNVAHLAGLLVGLALGRIMRPLRTGEL